MFIQLKCHKYWPEESETYGQITVTATRKEQYADYVIRTFLLVMVCSLTTFFSSIVNTYIIANKMQNFKYYAFMFIQKRSPCV